MTRYFGHTITRCGLSWYVDRDPDWSRGDKTRDPGRRCTTLVEAKEHIRKLVSEVQP